MKIGHLYQSPRLDCPVWQGKRMHVKTLILNLIPPSFVPLVLAEGNSSVVDECFRYVKEGHYSLAVSSCRKAAGMVDYKSEKFSETLLALAEAQEHSGNPWLALDAVKRIVDEIETGNYREKALARKATLYIKLGDFSEARAIVEQMKDEDRRKAIFQEYGKAEEAYKTIENLFKEQRWHDVDRQCRELISDHTPYFRGAFDMRIKALFSLKEVPKAIDVARSKARIETDSSETDFLIGKLYLSMGNLKVGRKFINECCKLNPENRKCMALRSKLKYFDQVLEEAEKRMLLKDAVEALQELQQLIEAVPENEIYYDKNFPQLFQSFKIPVLKLLCTKQSRRKQLNEAQVICEEAKKLDTTNQDYYLIVLGELYLSQDKYDEALDNLRQAHNINPRNREVGELMQKAEKAKREKMRTRYYDILGVQRDATEEEIKKAHNRLVRKFHPDKQLDEAAKKTAEQKMHDINAAYDVLSDKKKRQQYDAGFDPNDPNAAAQGFHYGGFGGFGGFGRQQGGGEHRVVFNMDDLNDLFGGRSSKGKKRGRKDGFDFFRDDL